MHAFKCPGRGPRHCAERINHLVMNSPMGTGIPVGVKMKTQQTCLQSTHLFPYLVWASASTKSRTSSLQWVVWGFNKIGHSWPPCRLANCFTHRSLLENPFTSSATTSSNSPVSLSPVPEFDSQSCCHKALSPDIAVLSLWASTYCQPLFLLHPSPWPKMYHGDIAHCITFYDQVGNLAGFPAAASRPSACCVYLFFFWSPHLHFPLKH